MSQTKLFYSKYCRHCKHFILQLKKNDLLSYFKQKICIDDPNIKRNLPLFLKEVPTIITNDYDKPLASDMAFKWITYKMTEEPQNNQQQNTQPQNNQQQNTQPQNNQQRNMQPQNNQQRNMQPQNIESFSFNNNDVYGSISNADESFKTIGKLDIQGKTLNTMINYDAFKLINPTNLKKDSNGKTIGSLIDYDSFKMSNDNMEPATVQSGGGNLDKDFEKLQKMRNMDDSFNSDTNQIRQ